MANYSDRKQYQREYIGSLPSIGVPDGSKSFISGEVFLWDGDEWGYVETSNIAPTWNNRIDATVFLEQAGATTTLDFGVTDPEGALLNYKLSYPTFTSDNTGTDPVDSLTFDIDTGVLVITPIITTDTCEKLIRVTVTDGINTVSKDVLLLLSQTVTTAADGGAIWTKPGVYTWVPPQGTPELIHIVCVGAGGGGSGMQSSTNTSGAGGGGGTLSYVNNVENDGSSLTITVGAGGSGGIRNFPGSNGGFTRVSKTGNGQVLIEALGGQGGLFSTAGAGGGVAGLNSAYSGGDGGSGATSVGSTGGGGGGAGGYGGPGGTGGSSSFIQNLPVNGQNGTAGIGGGGAGGSESISSPGLSGGGGTGFNGLGLDGTPANQSGGVADPEYNNGAIINLTGDGSNFFSREVTVNGVRIVAAGTVGGQTAVPDAFVEKVARMFELFTDVNGAGINEASQRTFIKTLSGDAGTYHAAVGPTLQRVARGAGADYTPNFLTDAGIASYNLSPLFDSHVANDMVWYLNSTGDPPGDGDNDAQEVIEHVFHTLHMHGLDAVSLKMYSYISADWASGPLYAAMEEAYDAGKWDSSGYGGNAWKTDGDAFEVAAKEYLFLLNFGMFEYSSLWDGGSLAPEWTDDMRTQSGIQTNNPLGYALHNTYIAPVISKPSLTTIRNIFQDGDVGDPTIAGVSGYVVPSVGGGGGGGSGGGNGDTGAGGFPGGGGSGTAVTTNTAAGFGKNGAGGAVRIIWGAARNFPATNAANTDSVVQEQDYS